MKLVSLALRHFRQHHQTELTFRDGLTGIIGANGAGKSTLMEAIVFALFGSKALRGTLDQVSTRGVKFARAKRGEERDETRVSLVFQHNSVTYRINRTLTDAEIAVGGEANVLSKGSQEVTSRVNAILGMNLDEFLSTYFTEQKGLEFLSAKKGTAERERFLVKMMGFDKLEDLHELLRGDKREKKAALSGYESVLGQRTLIVERIDREKEAINLNEAKLKEVSQIFEELSQGCDRRKVDFERIEAVSQKAKVLELEAENAKVKLSERELQIEQISQRRKKINLLGADKFSVTDQEQVNFETAQLQEQLEKQEASWRAELLDLRAQKLTLERLVGELSARLKLKSELQQSEPCPSCGQPLLEGHQQVLAHLNDELELKQQNLEQLKLSLLELQIVPQEITEIKAKLLVLKDQQNKLQEQQRAANDLKDLAIEEEQLHSDIAVRKERVLKLNQQSQSLGFDPVVARRIEVEYRTSERLLEVKRLERMRVEGQVELAKSHLLRSEEELVNFDTQLIKINELKAELVVFEIADKTLTDFRRYLNEQLRPRLSEIASQYLAELTDGRYTTVEITEDFSPIVIEDGSAKEVISGGEQDVLNLCTRLALSQMLAERAGHEFSLLILDEIFGSLDANRRANVVTLLERLRGRFEQILIITHLDDVRDGVQHLVSVNYLEETAGAEVVEESLVGVLQVGQNF